MSRRLIIVVAAAAGLLLLPFAVAAHQMSGAIFTTLSDGTEVNQNLFPTKEDVYLDGGPGPGAPIGAAGLEDGNYVFQVTEPPGKVLLSTDKAKCRTITAAGGIFTSLAPQAIAAGCGHVLSFDTDHGIASARTVQLMPYKNTPNNGGEYKVWITRIEDYVLGCRELTGNPALTEAQALEFVDCGFKEGGTAHGFIPAHSKTDNFKVKVDEKIREIDVCFFDDSDGDGHFTPGVGRVCLPGLQALWTDTLGVQNVRWADPRYRHGTFAHVEAPEVGTHYITISSGPGCNVGLIHVNKNDFGYGPLVVPITFLKSDPDGTFYIIDVACLPNGS